MHMTFAEALNEVITQNKIVQRKAYDHADAMCGAWSEWVRMRLEENPRPLYAYLHIESNNHDDKDFYWTQDWTSSVLSKEDILAIDWELEEE
jgi:hypothetical protein